MIPPYFKIFWEKLNPFPPPTPFIPVSYYSFPCLSFIKKKLLTLSKTESFFHQQCGH